MSGTSHAQLPTRLPCCYSRDIGPPGQQPSLQKDFTELEFPKGGSLHKGKDGLCSIIQCRFWFCRVKHLKLKGPGPCATCRAATSLHKLHTKQDSPRIKSNHAACTPPIKENENTRCALVGGVAPEPGASTITDSHLERRARASSVRCAVTGNRTRHGDFSRGTIVSPETQTPREVVPPRWRLRPNAEKCHPRYRPETAREVSRGPGTRLSPGVPSGRFHSPSSLSSNTGLRALAADMDDIDILFFHLLH